MSTTPPPTDPTLERAYRAWAESRIGYELTDEGHGMMRSDTEIGWLRAALAAAAEPVHEHAITFDFSGGYLTATFACNAPLEAMCHAEWSCDCEIMYDLGVRNGVPAHRPDYDDPDTWHAGTFVATTCNMRDWYDGELDNIRGEITVPVRAEWNGDAYEFVVGTAEITTEQGDTTP